MPPARAYGEGTRAFGRCNSRSAGFGHLARGPLALRAPRSWCYARRVPSETAFFVARPRWSVVLKQTSQVYAAWLDALEEGFVDYEDEWRQFPELLPFRRLETELQSDEVATLIALLRCAAPPSEGETADDCARRLQAAPVLTNTERELLETLEYDW